MKKYISVVALTLPFLLGVATCHPKVEDSSEMALVANNATIVLGGCSRPWSMGYEVCQLSQGKPIPKLQIGFMNPGEWAVSNCTGGFYKAGTTPEAGIVEVDLSGLQGEADKYNVCWVRVEAVEYYSDANDKNQKRSIPIAGGFIVEFLAPGYMPVPAEDLVAWCYQVKRTTKGRTELGRCR